MEKFKVYSNDPYDFYDLKQITDFYELMGNKDVLKKITAENKDKIYLRIVADKAENTVLISLYQDRSKEAASIILPDLVIEEQEFSLKESEKFLDMSEYLDLL